MIDKNEILKWEAKMKTRFMGNGLRIQNILQCLISDCMLRVYHVKSGQYLLSGSPCEIINYMLDNGFASIYMLEVIVNEVQNKC